MSKIIFDIETSGYNWNSFDSEQQKYLLKFAETKEDEEKARQQLSLYALTAEIVCIGMLNPETNKGAVYYRSGKSSDTDDFTEDGILYSTGDEREILEKFWDSIKKYQQFITFNGRGFDCPFLLVRSALLKIRPTKNLMPYRYGFGMHVDLLEQLNYYGATRKFSLDFYCKAFGIDSPKMHGITGHDVTKLFKENKTLEIAKYCLGDLRATSQLYEYWDKYLRFTP